MTHIMTQSATVLPSSLFCNKGLFFAEVRSASSSGKFHYASGEVFLSIVLVIWDGMGLSPQEELNLHLVLREVTVNADLCL